MPFATNDSGSRMDISSSSASTRERISPLDHVLRIVGSTPLCHTASTVAPGNAPPMASGSARSPTNIPRSGGELGVTSPSSLGICGNMNESTSPRQYEESGSAASISPVILADTFSGESSAGATTSTSPVLSAPNASAVRALRTASTIGP